MLQLERYEVSDDGRPGSDGAAAAATVRQLDMTRRGAA